MYNHHSGSLESVPFSRHLIKYSEVASVPLNESFVAMVTFLYCNTNSLIVSLMVQIVCLKITFAMVFTTGGDI